MKTARSQETLKDLSEWVKGLRMDWQPSFVVQVSGSQWQPWCVLRFVALEYGSRGVYRLVQIRYVLAAKVCRVTFLASSDTAAADRLGAIRLRGAAVVLHVTSSSDS